MNTGTNKCPSFLESWVRTSAQQKCTFSQWMFPLTLRWDMPVILFTPKKLGLGPAIGKHYSKTPTRSPQHLRVAHSLLLHLMGPRWPVLIGSVPVTHETRLQRGEARSQTHTDHRGQGETQKPDLQIVSPLFLTRSSRPERVQLGFSTGSSHIAC